MPILKRIVNITDLGGEFEVTDIYGKTSRTFTVDKEMSLEEFLFGRLNLRPGDRIQTDILDDENPVARIGRPRPGAGNRRRPQATD